MKPTNIRQRSSNMVTHRSSLYVLTLTMVLALVLFGGAGSILAQEAGPTAAAGQPAGTAFTYQGQLLKNDLPLSAVCTMQFSLYDQATGGNLVGGLVTQPVTVTEGLFATSLDFGPDIFTGDARWLAAAAQCPGDAGYTDLGPRQPLAPAPYALALPGMRTQQNATSPNVIGGYSGNGVDPGIYGATIGGGGWPGSRNNITAAMGTIGGGAANSAGGDKAAVGGGYYNRALGDSSVIAGGLYNIATEGQSTVAGGRNNSAGWNSAVGGGQENVAATEAATVAGGWANHAGARYSTVAGGNLNLAGTEFSAVGGGLSNAATGSCSVVGGGHSNSASGTFATVPGGRMADAARYGELAFASGSFNTTKGLAQTSTFVLRNTTTDANPTALYLDGVGQTIWMTTTSALAFDALVVGQSDAGQAAAYRITGLIKSVGGTVSFVGTPAVTVLGEDVPAWDASVATAPQVLLVNVTGAAATTIRWVATVHTSQVAW
jgi:hypothetical protein